MKGTKRMRVFIKKKKQTNMIMSRGARKNAIHSLLNSRFSISLTVAYTTNNLINVETNSNYIGFRGPREFDMLQLLASGYNYI